ncbi:hypothetical protein [Saccharothrix sp. Mg75]|uniref:hypothetical protein n=1 Tax=Saccharothrix sp. Mg75 TaxID=3445357 RepID=UPI003EEDB9AC
MAARGEARADVEVSTLVVPAWQLRWRAPELALVLGERAVALASTRRDEVDRLRAEALVVFASNRMGRGVKTADRALDALKAAEVAAQHETAWRLRVELADSARSVGAPLTGFAAVRPVLEADGVPPALRAGALVQAAECLVSVGRGPALAQALDEADRLYQADPALDHDTTLLHRGLLRAAGAGQYRRWGDLAAAVDACREGLSHLDRLQDPESDNGQVRGRLSVELVCALLDSGKPGEASEVGTPLLERPVRAPSAATTGWLRLALATRVHLPAGRVDQARDLLRDAADSAERHQLDTLLAESLLALAHVHEVAGNLPEALVDLRSAHAAERRRARAVYAVRARLAAEFSGVHRHPVGGLHDDLTALLSAGSTAVAPPTPPADPALTPEARQQLRQWRPVQVHRNEGMRAKRSRRAAEDMTVDGISAARAHAADRWRLVQPFGTDEPDDAQLPTDPPPATPTAATPTSTAQTLTAPTSTAQTPTGQTSTGQTSTGQSPVEQSAAALPPAAPVPPAPPPTSSPASGPPAAGLPAAGPPTAGRRRAPDPPPQTTQGRPEHARSGQARPTAPTALSQPPTPPGGLAQGPTTPSGTRFPGTALPGTPLPGTPLPGTLPAPARHTSATPGVPVNPGAPVFPAPPTGAESPRFPDAPEVPPSLNSSAPAPAPAPAPATGPTPAPTTTGPVAPPPPAAGEGVAQAAAEPYPTALNTHAAQHRAPGQAIPPQPVVGERPVDQAGPSMSGGLGFGTGIGRPHVGPDSVVEATVLIPRIPAESPHPAQAEPMQAEPMQAEAGQAEAGQEGPAQPEGVRTGEADAVEAEPVRSGSGDPLAAEGAGEGERSVPAAGLIAAAGAVRSGRRRAARETTEEESEQDGGESSVLDNLKAAGLLDPQRAGGRRRAPEAEAETGAAEALAGGENPAQADDEPAAAEVGSPAVEGETVKWKVEAPARLRAEEPGDDVDMFDSPTMVQPAIRDDVPPVGLGAAFVKGPVIPTARVPEPPDFPVPAADGFPFPPLTADPSRDGAAATPAPGTSEPFTASGGNHSAAPRDSWHDAVETADVVPDEQVRAEAGVDTATDAWVDAVVEVEQRGAARADVSVRRTAPFREEEPEPEPFVPRPSQPQPAQPAEEPEPPLPPVPEPDTTPSVPEPSQVPPVPEPDQVPPVPVPDPVPSAPPAPPAKPSPSGFLGAADVEAEEPEQPFVTSVVVGGRTIELPAVVEPPVLDSPSATRAARRPKSDLSLAELLAEALVAYEDARREGDGFPDDDLPDEDGDGTGDGIEAEDDIAPIGAVTGPAGPGPTAPGPTAPGSGPVGGGSVEPVPDNETTVPIRRVDTPRFGSWTLPES